MRMTPREIIETAIFVVFLAVLLMFTYDSDDDYNPYYLYNQGGYYHQEYLRKLSEDELGGPAFDTGI